MSRFDDGRVRVSVALTIKLIRIDGSIVHLEVLWVSRRVSVANICIMVSKICLNQNVFVFNCTVNVIPYKLLHC